jgi:hypothetical protein
MKLSKNHKKIISTLEKNKLDYLINPFLKLISLNEEKKIIIHKMEWSHILHETYQNGNSKMRFEQVITSFLHLHKIKFAKPNKERIKEYRRRKKLEGYKTISFQISLDDFEKLSKYKSNLGFTYEQALHELLKCTSKSL